MQIIGAAGLGSSFCQLHRATEYITARIFDPKYNQVYLIRFALGIIGGVILGQFGRQLFPENEVTGGETLKGIWNSNFWFARRLFGGSGIPSLTEVRGYIGDRS